jgi:hypothetical protein
MSSTAISAQGAILSIGTGSGSPATVSGVTVGNPTIIAATAHGFNNGDRVTFSSGFTGANAADINGLTFTVAFKETNAFAIEVDTTGHTITGTGTATPVTLSAIGNLRTFNGLDGAAVEIDRTNLASTAKEFILGLVDPGHGTFECDHDLSDAGQIALAAHQVSGVIANFKYALPNGDAYTFSAYVKKFALTSGVDQIVKRQVELRISGAVTKTP